MAPSVGWRRAVAFDVAKNRGKKRRGRRVERAERETTRAELALPVGEVAAARAIARRLGQVVFSITDSDAGTRRLAFEPPDDRWALAYAVDPTGALVLGPAAPARGRGSGEPGELDAPDAPDGGSDVSDEPGPSSAARAAAGAASVRHRRRTIERLKRRAATLEGLAEVDERSWAGVDRLVPEGDRRDVRTFALSGVTGKAVAARLREIIARELAALDAELTEPG